MDSLPNICCSFQGARESLPRLTIPETRELYTDFLGKSFEGNPNHNATSQILNLTLTVSKKIQDRFPKRFSEGMKNRINII